jgi:hypothetical protein
MDCIVAALPCTNASRLLQAMTVVTRRSRPYAFFARIEETLPPNMPTIRRTSDFNWNGSLL